MALAPLALSVFLLLLQGVVLWAVVEESSLPRCVEHDQCNLGEWCGPVVQGVLNGRQMRASVSMCDDCSSVAQLFADADALAFAGEEWLSAGMAHCDGTDTRPDRCDHLVKHRESLTGGNMLMLVVVCTLLASRFLEDLKHQSRELELLAHRVQGLAQSRRPYVGALAWCSIRLRRFVLPGFVAMATAGVLLSGPLTSMNILLGGLVISFMFSMDDALAELLLSPSQWDNVFRAFGSMSAKGGAAADRNLIAAVTWLMHRTYVVAMSAGVMAAVLNAEVLVAAFSADADVGAPCSGLAGALIKAFSLVVFSAASFDALVRCCVASRGERLMSLGDAALSPLYVLGTGLACAYAGTGLHWA